jgi:pyruvate,water dikinase
MGVAHQGVAMGVVVQGMVPAEVSGILFTANPATGSREELLINASYGLGESIVSNVVTPDIFRINRKHRSILEQTISKKTMMTVLAEDRVSTEEVAKAERSKPSLGEVQLQELADVGERIEELFDGDPQDIEWSYANHKLFILQSRPITRLPEAPIPPAKWEPPIKGSKWIRRQITENMPDPLSPLFDDLYLREGLDRSMSSMQQFMRVPRSMDKLYNRPLFGTVNGYAYMRADFNFSPVMIPLVFGAMAAGITYMLRGGGIRYWGITLKEYQVKVSTWRAIDPQRMAHTELYEAIRQMADADAAYWFGATLAFGTAKSTEGIFAWFLKTFMRGKHLSTGMFLRGFSSKTLEAQALLEQIANQAQKNPTLRQLVLDTPAGRLRNVLAYDPAAEAVSQHLDLYFEDYGHQTYSIDFAEPVLVNTPETVMRTLKTLVSQTANHHPVQREDILAQRETLIAETLRTLGPVRRRLFKKLLGLAFHYGPFREESLFYVGYAWPKLRQCASELGGRLVKAQILSAPDDIYFLTSQELAEAVQFLSKAGSTPKNIGKPPTALAKWAKYRKALRESQKQIHPPGAVPESFMFKLGRMDLASRESQVREKSSGPIMKGFAVSPGQVTAPACVILSPVDFHKMKAGCILVCATTTPAWTPLFSQAVGLVTDIGGILAHGSIVAREFGLPAVMGTGNATQRIRDGQVITVDGTDGKVILGEEEDRL